MENIKLLSANELMQTIGGTQEMKCYSTRDCLKTKNSGII